MKTKDFTPKRVIYTIDFNPEKKIVELSTLVGDDEPKLQVFNLEILPLDMVMSSICQLLVPRNNVRQ